MANESLVILTGASRGLGAALARQLLGSGCKLLTISRHPDESLRSASPDGELEQWASDLAHDSGAAPRLDGWLRKLDGSHFESATLVNNAGVLGRVGPIDASDSETLAAVLRVGLEAPMLLAAAFLRATRSWAIDKRVLNISSGAGRRPIAGWAAYCAAKAGLDHFTRVTALDEELQKNPARVASLAPGVIDTAMQGVLRAADPIGFPDKPVFENLKASGQLAAPDDAAARVIAYLRSADFGAPPIADVRAA